MDALQVVTPVWKALAVGTEEVTVWARGFKAPTIWKEMEVTIGARERRNQFGRRVRWLRVH